MHPTLLYRPGVTGWQLDGPLSPYVGGFVAQLQRGQYSRVTAEKYVSALLEFGQWMRQHRPQAQQIDGPCITEFLRSSGGNRDRHAALGHLLAVLREQGVVTEVLPSGPTRTCYAATTSTFEMHAASHLGRARALCESSSNCSAANSAMGLWSSRG